MANAQPRSEHPRPQFQRDNWMNLNGTWNFAFDFGSSGEQKGWPSDPSDFDKTITVPFCPESELSGIQHTDFIPSVWYHRILDIPNDWKSKRILLHFGAVDYHCKTWVNGQSVGQHYGGGASFTFDITSALQDGENNLVVCANDDTRSGDQPQGKQCPDLHSRRCHYTRTTGIWQTVWLEAVSTSHIDHVRVVPDLDSNRFVLTPSFKNAKRGHIFKATLLDGNAEVAVSSAPALDGAAMSLRVTDPHLWSLE
ncbi:MAG: beta-glucuronidase, partial [Candidatus Latescibacteria bacterium]|nr:beta-glucuronidase [Candidatus Latescibacterota bacterium]